MSQYYPLQEPHSPSSLHGAVREADPSLNGREADSLDTVFRLESVVFKATFLSAYELDYLIDDSMTRGFELRVVSHPKSTTTCFEKAEMLGWDPLNVIKALYFEDIESGLLYAVVVPETGCFVDVQGIANLLGIVEPGRLRKASSFPRNMERGTCSPFITVADLLANGGKLDKIFFDTGAVLAKRNSGILDDFSFGLDHRLSIQLNYAHAYEVLRARFPASITEGDVLALSFKEVMVRSKGKIKLRYEFDSLNYRTAAFFSNMHGSGDVSVSNDYVDELDLPDLLKPE